MSRKISRRDFVRMTAGGAAVAALGGLGGFPFIRKSQIDQKVLLLGIDGMDPQILKRLIAEGRMPTFARLVEQGRFRELQTTLPPQSPVAWSSFITGSNPGKHGIYDFIARDPATFSPYLSTSRTFPSNSSISLGNWKIPLKSAHVALLRKGVPFWSVLEEHDIPVVLSQLPANFPVQQSRAKVLSGMGTPDVLGTYGTSTFFSEVGIPGSEKFTGARVILVNGDNHVFRTALGGPANSFRKDSAAAEVPFSVFRDPWEQAVKIVIQGHEILLKAGEWTDWIPVRFELLPVAAGVSGMVRIYLQSVHPHLRLYFSPVNMDPFDPALPVSSPEGYSADLAENVGRFYTQGFPEDTKSLSHGIFSDAEFFTQAKLVLEERRSEFDYQLRNFKEGVLFFYFSSVDQCSHMLWRTMHSDHPLFPAGESEEVLDSLPYMYRQMDDVLRQTLDSLDSRTTLLVLSDHGFAPFTREINLSTWLVENGFTAFPDREAMPSTDFYEGVEWRKTRAYVLGINSIYLNLKGREKNGVVEPAKAEALKREIIAGLLALKDPQNGEQVVFGAYDAQKSYRGPEVKNAPDIIVGYQRGYRISDQSVLGKFPRGIVADRTDKWSADHCMDPRIVPGVCFSNRDIKAETPALWDLGPSVIRQFGLEIPGEMDGQSIL